VSKGPVISQVPDVTGDTQSDAVQLLRQAGFQSSVIKQDVTDPSQDGLVLSENPPGGTLKEGSVVTITVGRLVTTPNETVPTTTTTPTTTATTTAPPATTVTATTTTTPPATPPALTTP
jgi:beta-lactam-binding protein with PASTA domain